MRVSRPKWGNQAFLETNRGREKQMETIIVFYDIRRISDEIQESDPRSSISL